MENIKYNKYGFYSCSTTGANPCVKLIMLSFRSKVYQSIVVLTLYTTQASALCFKLLMLLKENTWIRVLYKRQIVISHHYRRWEGIFLLSVAVCFKMFPSLRIFQRNKILCFYLVKRRREKELNSYPALSYEKINFIHPKKVPWLNYLFRCLFYGR